MLNDTQCCGVLEVSGLEDTAKESLLEICDDWFTEGPVAYITFTDKVRSGRGEKLYKYIVKNKLGPVITHRSKINPNSDNKIKIWVWSVNNKRLETWHLKNGGEEEKEPDYF